MDRHRLVGVLQEHHWSPALGGCSPTYGGTCQWRGGDTKDDERRHAEHVADAILTLEDTPELDLALNAAFGWECRYRELLRTSDTCPPTETVTKTIADETGLAPAEAVKLAEKIRNLWPQNHTVPPEVRLIRDRNQLARIMHEAVCCPCDPNGCELDTVPEQKLARVIVEYVEENL